MTWGQARSALALTYRQLLDDQLPTLAEPVRQLYNNISSLIVGGVARDGSPTAARPDQAVPPGMHHPDERLPADLRRELEQLGAFLEERGVDGAGRLRPSNVRGAADELADLVGRFNPLQSYTGALSGAADFLRSLAPLAVVLGVLYLARMLVPTRR